MASIAGNLCLLTQFMSSQGPCFLLVISWILMLKNDYLVVLTLLLNIFQFSRLHVVLYLLNTILHSSFHQLLDHLIILTCFEFALHTFLILEASMLVTNLSLLILDKSSTLMFLIAYEMSLIKLSSSLLFFAMENFDVTMFSSVMEIITVRGVWSEESCQSWWIEWLLSSIIPLCKNMRLMTEFTSPVMSKYLVGI